MVLWQRPWSDRSVFAGIKCLSPSSLHILSYIYTHHQSLHRAHPAPPLQFQPELVCGIQRPHIRDTFPGFGGEAHLQQPMPLQAQRSDGGGPVFLCAAARSISTRMFTEIPLYLTEHKSQSTCKGLEWCVPRLRHLRRVGIPACHALRLPRPLLRIVRLL